MKKIWALEKREGDTWTFAEGNFNYKIFCYETKGYLQLKVNEASKNLKESLGVVPYSDEIKQKYRDMYAELKDSFRVVEGEVEDNAQLPPYNLIKVNEKVYKFLWDTKR